MYQTILHRTLLKALYDSVLIASSDNEDNYRHVLCSCLYKYINPDNVTAPSTASGGGDIVVLNKKIELKYSNTNNLVKANDVENDFVGLLHGDTDFFVCGVKINSARPKDFFDRHIGIPMLKRKGAKAAFGDSLSTAFVYKRISLFLAATCPRNIENTNPSQKGLKKSTGFLGFESAAAIARSSFLQIGTKRIVHVDTIGSYEDGLLIFLYKLANDLIFQVHPSTKLDLFVPYAPAPLSIASEIYADVYAKDAKSGKLLQVDKRARCFLL